MTAVLAVAVIVAALFASSSVAASAPKDLRAEQERVRRQKAAVASQLDVLKASDAEVQAALAAVDGDLRQEEAALEAAQRTEADEERTAADLQAREAAAQDQLAGLDRRLSDSLVDAYVHPALERGLASVVSADVNERLAKEALFEFATVSNRDVASSVRSLREELAGLEAERVASLERARQARTDVEARVAVVRTARDEQTKLVAAADARVDQALSELDELASTDQHLASQIEAAARALAAEAARARSASPAATVTAFVPPPNSELVSVNGIVVHVSLAGRLRDLLAAASAAGITLGGSGYRDVAEQVALRRQNCGSTDLAIYQMDPFQCRPPTARPGSSNHERGLAVDFTQNGAPLTRGSTGFVWLTKNAARFGMYNLAAEPWHWSVDGK